MSKIAVCITAALLLTGGACAPQAATTFDGTPPGNRSVLYTATDSVHGLIAAPDGSLWTATAGGVVEWPAGGGPARRWTTVDGLPSNEAEHISSTEGGIDVSTSGGDGVIDGRGRVTLRPARKQEPTVRLATAVDEADGDVIAEAAVGKARYVATALGLWKVDGGRSQGVPYPAGSRGSHVSALCVSHGRLVAALYGDGLWQIDGARWMRLPGLPPSSSTATALTDINGDVAVGTMSNGVWKSTSAGWVRLEPAVDTPSVPSTDIQAITVFDGSVWASTFDHGLLKIDNSRGVTNVTAADGLSSNYPRALAVFDGRLLVRSTSGGLDAFDGHTWTPAFGPKELPRPYVSALSTDGTDLLIGGWGGWASTDGHSWEYHYDEPELKGRVVTSIAKGDGAVWVGTQNGGVFEYRDGRYTSFDETKGLQDDWVTSIAASNGRVLIGTYTGGLYELDGDKMRLVFLVDKFAIRNVVIRPDGTAVAATPLGVYVEDRPTWRLLDPRRYGGLESQALLSTPRGLWVGSHSSLAYLPM